MRRLLSWTSRPTPGLGAATGRAGLGFVAHRDTTPSPASVRKMSRFPTTDLPSIAVVK